MTRVGMLKHSTYREQYRYMKFVMDWKADLKEKQAIYAQKKIDETLGDLMWELRGLDLAWEAWFDDDHNVPNASHAQLIPIIERRIADLKIPQPLCKR
jgi:hypothetical protein